jgi:hypothetical protein
LSRPDARHQRPAAKAVRRDRAGPLTTRTEKTA